MPLMIGITQCLRKTKLTKCAVNLVSGALLLFSSSLVAKAEITISDFINSSSGLFELGLNPPPVINDNGVIVFGTNFSGYEGSFGLVYGSTSNPGVIHALNNQTFEHDNGFTIDPGFINTFSLGINNSGNVLWLNDAFGYRTLATVNIATPNAPEQLSETASSISGRSLGMNNHGLVTYRVGSGVYGYDTNAPTSLPREIVTGNNLYPSGATAVNDSGKIIYGTLGPTAGVFVYDWASNSTTALAPSNVRFSSSFSDPAHPHPDINNAGLAAFFALDAETDQLGLYTMNIGDPAGDARFLTAINDWANGPISLNDAGMILFIEAYEDLERTSGFGYTLKLWDGEAVQSLLSVGDAFGGGIIDSFEISSYALNNSGQAVFSYWLEDGVTMGVGMITIPEPSVVLLLAGAGLFGGVVRYRRLRAGVLAAGNDLESGRRGSGARQEG